MYYCSKRFSPLSLIRTTAAREQASGSRRGFLKTHRINKSVYRFPLAFLFTALIQARSRSSFGRNALLSLCGSLSLRDSAIDRERTMS